MMYFSAVCCQTIQSFGLTSDNIQTWMRCTFVKNIMFTTQYTVIAMKIHGFSLGNDLQTVDFSIFFHLLVYWRVSTCDKTVGPGGPRWAPVGPGDQDKRAAATHFRIAGEVLPARDDWVVGRIDLGLHHKVSRISSLYIYIYTHVYIYICLYMIK